MVLNFHLEKSTFYFKNIFLFGIIALSFSMIGFFLDGKTSPHDPLPSASIEHAIGHIIWGAIIGIASRRIEYVILGGSFGILIDIDHLVNFLGFDLVSRMGHSLFFMLISFLVLVIFNKRNYLLGAIAIGAIFSHISFDIFLKGYDAFPLLTPFHNELIVLQNSDWIILEIFAILLILVVSIKQKNDCAQ